MAILLKGRISPIAGGASAVEGLQSTGLPLLVLTCSHSYGGMKGRDGSQIDIRLSV